MKIGRIWHSMDKDMFHIYNVLLAGISQKEGRCIELFDWDENLQLYRLFNQFGIIEDIMQ